ncbi:glycosyltransferase family 2 protein [Dyadobacter psychrophilus]|uniref:Glycosyltransferase, GT2 family n=1 Tax=Dyadobacter psychrophilus TaxID=651661 RepID=A0A1T5HE80_9BACT|nr:glycosyltransferase family 2 protein [Dyadobacter psychrophilus]SKC18966.1 Glycosyltransferase, GT2 family [Dyadobacter psychrophilus]
MKNIAAVVVTFNRLALLKGCIKSLREQTTRPDSIIVVNNGSTDGTDIWLAQQADLQVIAQNNSGGAGGFYTGIKEAYQQEFNWIWVMDDDCVADKDCLSHMLDSLSSVNARCVAPIVVDRTGNTDTRHRGYFNFHNKLETTHTQIEANNENDKLIDFASFVGLMIHSSVVNEIGLPKKEFFIHNDDIEYCLRVNKISKILLSAKATINHLENATASTVLKSFLNHSRHRPPFEGLWIKYYGTRNLIWMKKQHMSGADNAKKMAFAFLIIRSMLRHLKDIAMYDDNKFRRANFYVSSYLDGWFGVFDNDKPKRILTKGE